MNRKDIRFWIYIIVHFLSSLISVEEFKLFLNDQRGGLVLPVDGIQIEDLEWIKYKSLKVDKSVKSINPIDLPEDFCEKACRLVDQFRRKTVNLNDEWMLFFDYKTGEVIYCFEGSFGECNGEYNIINLSKRDICSIHNHPKYYYSFPSAENFDILENEFEDYEIITSSNALWIIEFKGFVRREDRHDFQKSFSKKFHEIELSTIRKYNNMLDIHNEIEKSISDYLIFELDDDIFYVDLKLTKVLI